MQDLDERKRKILKAIIQTYLETGEPVGSRTISKYTDLNLSSATIRNEMSDLEDLGYIVQPHTSAGRIPSDLGYRLYVDELMKEKDQEVSEMKEMMIEKTDRMERVLKQVVKVLASNTTEEAVIWLEKAGVLKPAMMTAVERMKQYVEEWSGRTVCAEVVTFTNGYGILGMTCGAENMIEAFRIREEANEMQKE